MADFPINSFQVVTLKDVDEAIATLTSVTQDKAVIYCSPDIYQYVRRNEKENPHHFASSPVLPPVSAFALLETDSEGETADVRGFSFTILDQTLQCCYAYAAEAFFETWQYFRERGAGVDGTLSA